MTVRYAIVIEDAGANFGAYAPDVPGCVATGKTVEETTANMREALEFHFEGLRELGQPVPEPSVQVSFVDVEIPHAQGNRNA